MQIPKISIGDVLTMKKQHPCGSKMFKVLRVGSDIKITCMKCGHDVIVPRVKLEKNVKKIESSENIGNA